MRSTGHGTKGFTIKGFIISLVNDGMSAVQTRVLLQSIFETESNIQPFILPATTPETTRQDIAKTFDREYIKKIFDSNGRIRWTWPKSKNEEGLDLATGIYKNFYGEKDWKVKRACTVSHMRLWQHCIDIDEPILILEQDAKFVNRFTYQGIATMGDNHGKDVIGKDGRKHGTHSEVGEWTGGICGLNAPWNTTRKARIYDYKVKYAVNQMEEQYAKGLVKVPSVDEPHELPLASGLAGNSAYIIKPWAARKLLDKVAEVGLWPNDAIMCRQFFPWLQQAYPYHTLVQGGVSTTVQRVHNTK